MGATGSLWYFKQATSPGTTDYNTAGSNVPAGQNSFGIHLRPYFSTSATNTFSNIRFYLSTAWTSTTYNAVGTSATGYTQSTGSSTSATDGGGSSVGVPTGSATNVAIALGSLTLGSASGYGPTFLRVQLTTNASAPAGDTPFGGSRQSKLWALVKSFLINGRHLIKRLSSTSRLLVVQLQRLSEKTTLTVDATVRSLWKHRELDRNDLVNVLFMALQQSKSHGYNFFAQFKLREFGETLFESIPSQVLSKIRKGVETMHEALFWSEDIVRAIWRHIELNRNDLAAFLRNNTDTMRVRSLVKN